MYAPHTLWYLLQYACLVRLRKPRGVAVMPYVFSWLLVDCEHLPSKERLSSFFLILAVAFIARCGASQKSQRGVAYTIQRGGKVWPIVFLTRLINRLLSRATTLHISGNPHVCVCLLYGSSLSTTSYEPIKSKDRLYVNIQYNLPLHLRTE